MIYPVAMRAFAASACLLASLIALPPAARAATDEFVYTDALTAPGKSAGEQAKGIVDKLASALKAEGTTLDRTLQVSVYLRAAADLPAVDKAFKAAWRTGAPARTVLLINPVEANARLTVSAVALRPGPARKVIAPSGWPKPAGAFSYAVQGGNTLFLSGLSASVRGPIPADANTVGAQTRLALTAAGEILTAAGMTYADAVSSRVFVAESAMFDPMNVEYRPFFRKDPPPRATVRAGFVAPGELMQVSLIAAKTADRATIQIKRPDGSIAPQSPNYSVAMRVGKRFYGSGTVGGDSVPQEPIRVHARDSLSAIGHSVTAAGYDWSQVVHVLVYVQHASDREGVLDVLREIMPTAKYTVSIIETGLVIPNPRLEVMLTAVK